MTATVTVDGAAPSGAALRRSTIKEAVQLSERFSAAAHQAGLYHETSSAAGIPGLTGPRVTHVDLGQSPYLMVRTLDGQLIEDFKAAHDRIAAGLGATRLKISQRSRALIRFDINPPDPLGTDYYVEKSAQSGQYEVQFGRLENGQALSTSLLDCGQIAVQGQTRSGKTRWSYGFLRQLLGKNIEVAGIDPTAKLLGPFDGHPQGVDICASASYTDMLQVSQALYEDMRTRISAIPRYQDTLPIGEEWPLKVIVLEEWTNALTLAGIACKKSKGLDTELGRNVQMLLAEGHKAGLRIVMMGQRMSASAVGGDNRDNISHRLSFRTASKEGIKLLHEDVDDLTVARHRIERPGIALVEAPGIELQRLRAPTTADYGDYVLDVDRTNNGAVLAAA